MLNYSIASHEKVANPRIGARSDNSLPALAHHYHLHGVREKDSNVTLDYEIHHFEDSAHLHIPLSGSGNGSSINKRYKNQEIMYYRSIMEGQGSGENYEDVMACGDMGHLVGTYSGEPEC